MCISWFVVILKKSENNQSTTFKLVGTCDLNSLSITMLFLNLVNSNDGSLDYNVKKFIKNRWLTKQSILSLLWGTHQDMVQRTENLNLMKGVLVKKKLGENSVQTAKTPCYPPPPKKGEKGELR